MLSSGLPLFGPNDAAVTTHLQRVGALTQIEIERLGAACPSYAGLPWPLAEQIEVVMDVVWLAARDKEWDALLKAFPASVLDTPRAGPVAWGAAVALLAADLVTSPVFDALVEAWSAANLPLPSVECAPDSLEAAIRIAESTCWPGYVLVDAAARIKGGYVARARPWRGDRPDIEGRGATEEEAFLKLARAMR